MSSYKKLKDSYGVYNGAPTPINNWDWRGDDMSYNTCDWGYGYGPEKFGGYCKPEGKHVALCTDENDFRPVYTLGGLEDHKDKGACADKTYWSSKIRARCCNIDYFQQYLDEQKPTIESVSRADIGSGFVFPDEPICSPYVELHNVRWLGRKTEQTCESHNHSQSGDIKSPCDNSRENCAGTVIGKLNTLNVEPDIKGKSWDFQWG